LTRADPWFIKSQQTRFTPRPRAKPEEHPK
jgi:hypothetical protein